jgi:glycosyltransferase involved in cell wall biosynthesis
MTPTPLDFAPSRRKLANTRYLLVCPIGWCRDTDGEVWTDRLWAKDLLLHLEYLTHLTVLAPEQPMANGLPPRDWVRLVPRPGGLGFTDFPLGRSMKEALVSLPRQAIAAARAIRSSDVVHSGAAGWPLPPGLAVNPLAALLGKPLVVIIESAFWRNHAHSRGLKPRLRHFLTESFARWSCRRARLAVFTHQGYLEELLPRPRSEVMVSAASWIDASVVLSEERARACWEQKSAGPRFLVASRLVETKGIAVVIQAIEEAERTRRPLTIDFIGDGEMKESLRSLAERAVHTRIRLLESLPYGPEFFELIQSYHALIVPTVSDEQTRIIFDAFSQAVPVIASDTAANQEIVAPGKGILYDKASGTALLQCLDSVAPASLQEMGLQGLRYAQSRTHQAMHHARAVRLAELFGDDRAN